MYENEEADRVVITAFSDRGMTDADDAEYDAEADAFPVRFAADGTVDSEEVGPGVIFDLEAAGHIVAIEILDAKERLSGPALAAAE